MESAHSFDLDADLGDDHHDGDLHRQLRELQRRCDNLTIALETNRVTATAVGIIMATHRISDEQALELLKQVSQTTHRKLRHIADDIVFTGQAPPMTPTRSRIRASGRPRRA